MKSEMYVLSSTHAICANFADFAFQSLLVKKRYSTRPEVFLESFWHIRMLAGCGSKGVEDDPQGRGEVVYQAPFEPSVQMQRIKVAEGHRRWGAMLLLDRFLLQSIFRLA